MAPATVRTVFDASVPAVPSTRAAPAGNLGFRNWLEPAPVHEKPEAPLLVTNPAHTPRRRRP